MKDIILELSTDGLNKVQDFIDNKGWESLCSENEITTDCWESNLFSIEIEELKKEQHEIPFVYFHLEFTNNQLHLQAEWYPDNSGSCVFFSTNVRDVLNVEIEIKDLCDGYSCIRFKETKQGYNISEYLGKEIHSLN